MAIGKPIVESDIFSADLTANTVKEMEALLKVLGQVEGKMKDIVSLSAKTASAGAPKSMNDAAQHTENYKKATDAEKLHTQAMKESVKVQTELNALKAKERQAAKDEIAMRGAAKDSIVALSIELRKVTEEWNNASAAERGDLDTTGSLTQKKRLLTDQLSKLRQATGDHRMEVGKYAKAAQGLTGILHMMGEAIGLDETALHGLQAAHSALRTGMRDVHHLTELNTNATKGAAVADAEAAGANEALGASWLAAMGPLGIVIGLLGLAAGAIALYAYETNKAKQEEKERSKAMDGTVIVDKKLRDEYNETIITLHETANAYKVLSGEMSVTEAKMDSIRMKNQQTLADIKNETTEKLQEVNGFWHQVFNGIKDYVTTGGSPVSGVQSNFKEISAILQAEKIETDKANAEKAKADAEVFTELADAHRKRLEEEKEFTAKMKALRNENTRDELDKAIASVNIQRNLDLQKVDVNTKGDAGQDAVQKARINEEANQKIKNLQFQFHQEALAREVEFNVKLAQLTYDKTIIAKAEYDKELFDLNRMLVAKHASEEEALKERNLLHDKYQQQLHDIEVEKIKTNIETKTQGDSLIQNRYQRETLLARDAYDKQLVYLTQSHEKKLLSDEDFDERVLNAATKLNDDLAKINNERNERDLADAYKRSQLILKGDEIADKKLSVLTQDALDAENARYKAEWQKLVDDQNTTFQEMENAVKEHENNVNEIMKKAREARAKELAKEEEDTLRAYQEMLNAKAQRQEAAFAAENEQLSTQADVQAQLAAAGRKNTLAQTLKAQSDAAQQEADFQRKIQRQKEAADLAELFIKAEQAYLSAGSNPEQAALKALAQVALAKGLADGIAGAYFHGTDDTGPGGRIDANGGFLAMLHKHEAVIPEKRNREMPGLAKSWLKEGEKGVLNYMNAYYLPKIKADVSTDAQISKMLIDKIDERLASLERTIINKKEVTFVGDVNGNLIRKITENGNSQSRIINEEKPINLG